MLSFFFILVLLVLSVLTEKHDKNDVWSWWRLMMKREEKERGRKDRAGKCIQKSRIWTLPSRDDKRLVSSGSVRGQTVLHGTDKHSFSRWQRWSKSGNNLSHNLHYYLPLGPSNYQRVSCTTMTTLKGSWIALSILHRKNILYRHWYIQCPWTFFTMSMGPQPWQWQINTRNKIRAVDGRDVCDDVM